MDVDRLLSRAYTVAGIALLGYMAWGFRSLFRTYAGAGSHDLHNRTDNYCWTCDKALP